MLQIKIRDLALTLDKLVEYIVNILDKTDHVMKRQHSTPLMA